MTKAETIPCTRDAQRLVLVCMGLLVAATILVSLIVGRLAV